MPFVEVNGFNIFYDDQGSGPVLIFLHGGGGNATSWWQQVPYFSKSFRCISIDNRGFGRSHPILRSATDVPQYASDILALLDQLEIEEAAVVSQSLGGWTALRMAMQAPERIWALVAANSQMGLLYPEAAQHAVRLVQSLGDKAAGIEEIALSERFRTEKPELFYLYRQLNLFNPLALRGADFDLAPMDLVGSMFSPQTTIDPAEISELTTPTLLLGGRHDPLVKAEFMVKLADYFTNGRTHIFEDTGHSPYFENPTAFNAVLEEFLTKLRP